MVHVLWLVIFLCVYSSYCSEDSTEKEGKKKEIVGEKITIYTAKGPIPATITDKDVIYHYELKEAGEESSSAKASSCVKTSADRLADKKGTLNEFKQAEILLKKFKLKHKL